MSHGPTLAVLHGLRLGSVVPAEDLPRRSGLPPEVVRTTLEACSERGLVRHSGGRLPGWALTRAGRDENERLLAVELDATGARPVVVTSYREFLRLNARVLTVCTDWQVIRRDGHQVPNDHGDPTHDLAVLDRLGRLHGDARPLLRRLAGALERFAEYDRRLDRALRLTLSGRTEWFTRPTIDSYHSVWFELHEDLLATLGRQRSAEHDQRTEPLQEHA
jgi:hypothetical protein